MNNELCVKSTKKRRRKFTELELKIKEANTSFIQNNLDECISKAKEVLSKYPKCDRAYFLLGLVFEEKHDIIKAYNFYLIAAQLMKNNYYLWFKLYKISDSLKLFSDKLYFIQILQRYKNTKELVVEKLELFRMLKNKYKVLECQIELFEFDGVDFSIFEKIKNQKKHKLKTSVMALLLLKYYKKHPSACGIEFLMNCVRLQYESGYLVGTKNILETWLFPNINVIPNDIRIIYIVSCIANNKTNDRDSLFKNLHDENEPEIATDFNYKSISEKVFSITTSILPELNKNDERSKTLKLETFDQLEGISAEEKYKKYADLDLFLLDESFWCSFREENEIKPLVEVLMELKMYSYTIKLIHKLLDICNPLKEFCLYYLGEISLVKEDYNMASSFYEQVLQINPDNVSVKSKLYKVYLTLGNKDMANHYKTVNSLINYVDDISNRSKEASRFSFEKCEVFRDIYYESRHMFEINNKEHLKTAKPLIDDFLENEFIFIKHKKFKKFSTTGDKKNTNLCLLNVSDNDNKEKNKLKDNVRHLSIHGLDDEEWFYTVFEYIISKIKNKNYLEASFLLRKTYSAFIFNQRKDFMAAFFFLTIRHAVYNDDLSLLAFAFKKAISIFENYNLSYFFFYLYNYFINPHVNYQCSMFVQNLKRYYIRNLHRGEDLQPEGISGSEDGFELEEDSNNTQTEAPVNTYKVDNLCFLNTYFNGTVFNRTFKNIDKIKNPLTFNEEILKNIILALACKSRTNVEKNDMIKKALAGLNGLLKEARGEPRFVILFNIGKVYDMIGFVGYAERYYKEAYQTTNRELKRLSQLNLILIYKKNGNNVLLEKYFNDEI